MHISVNWVFRLEVLISLGVIVALELCIVYVFFFRAELIAGSTFYMIDLAYLASLASLTIFRALSCAVFLI